jgi:phage-related protein
MADADYRAWVEVLPSFDTFNSAVETSVITSMGTAGVAGSTAMGTSLVAGIGKFALPIAAGIAALGIGIAITDAVRAGVDAAVAYVQTSVGLAAELEQNVGAVSAVFKENANQIEAWSQNSAEALGLSRNSYLSYSAVVGAQLKNLGIPFDEVAGKTDGLITLGADLAAQFGGTTADAVTALSSLLRGERDPIERYGVSIKQADINARVAAMGLGDLTLEQQKQAEIMATLAILNEQSADAQGAFSRESDTFLNVQQRMQAVLEDTATELGTQLLPVLTEVMGFIKDELVPMWQEFNEQVGPELRAALEDMWPRLQDLIERLLPLIPPVLELIIANLALFADVMSDGIERLDFFIGLWSDLFALLNGDLTIDQFAANFQARLTDTYEAFKTVVTNIMGIFFSLQSSVGETLTNMGTTVYNGGRALIQKLVDGIKSKIVDAGNAVKGVLSYVRGFFPNSPAERGPFSGSGWDAVAGAGRAIMGQFAAGLVPVDVPLGFSTGLTVPSSARITQTKPDDSQTKRYAQIDPEQMRELLEAFDVKLLTDDTLLASSAGRGAGFQTALGAS